MVALQKLDDSMFEDVYQTFLFDDDPNLDREDWYRLFRTRTEIGADYSGYALVDGSKIGGVLGMLFSERRSGKDVQKFCSLHTWMVEPEYRGHSLMMMRPAMRMKEHTVSDFTPTEPVRKLSKRLGFDDLDATMRIMLPKRARAARRDGVELIDDSEAIKAGLTTDQVPLFDDHQMPHMRHLLCAAGSESCYLIYSPVSRWRLPYCHIHYISDASFFIRHSVVIREHILSTESAMFVAANDRQLRDNHVERSFRFRLVNGQLYRSNCSRPDQIDSLYSDVAFLNLTTMDSLSTILRERLSWK